VATRLGSTTTDDEPRTTGRARTRGARLDGEVDLARDRELVERCQAGDRTAFEELYRRYHRRLSHFCLRRLHEPFEAEDAAQEAFTRAWRAMPSFAGDRRFYPWLTVIAANVCTDVLRRGWRLTPVEDVPLPEVDPAGEELDAPLIRQVDASMALQALGNLSDRHRRVLQLREGSGWSTQRLAEHEGVAVPVMETLLWRARQALKREFAALTESGGRLGALLGLGLAALRRLLGRIGNQVATHVPVLDPLGARNPIALGSSLLLAGGMVASGVAYVGSNAAPPAVMARQTVTDASVGSGAVATPLPADSQGTGPLDATWPRTGGWPAGASGAPDALTASQGAGLPPTSGPPAGGVTGVTSGVTSGVTGVTSGVTSGVTGISDALANLGSSTSGASGNLGSTTPTAVSGLGTTVASLLGGTGGTAGTGLGSVVGGTGDLGSSLSGTVDTMASGPGGIGTTATSGSGNLPSGL
jgi:RNA polymerase sigma-70 factor (ECF subfamily)